MKSLLPIMFFCLCGCNTKQNPPIQEGVDFIIDTTLQMEYADTPYELSNCINKPVNSASDAFIVARSAINELKDEGIELCLPLRIHLVYDSIWIVRNEPNAFDKNMILFGGSTYMEIRKKDGCFLKSIIEE